MATAVRPIPTRTEHVASARRTSQGRRSRLAARERTLDAAEHAATVATGLGQYPAAAARLARPLGPRALCIHDVTPKRTEVRLVLTICTLDSGADLRQLRHDLLSANATTSAARFTALDGALQVEACVPAAEASQERIDDALDMLLARASSYEAATLRHRYHAR